MAVGQVRAEPLTSGRGTWPAGNSEKEEKLKGRGEGGLEHGALGLTYIFSDGVRESKEGGREGPGCWRSWRRRELVN